MVHGLTERSTNDLDFFTPAPIDVPLLRQALEIAFGEAGLTVAIVWETETFVRLAVGDWTPTPSSTWRGTPTCGRRWPAISGQ